MYRLYWSNAFKLTPRFSIGINIGYIRGEVIQSETQESATVEYSSKKRAFYAEFGMHYEWWLKENRNLSFGLTLSPAFAIKQENELTGWHMAQAGEHPRQLDAGKPLGHCLEHYLRRKVVEGKIEIGSYSTGSCDTSFLTFLL